VLSLLQNLYGVVEIQKRFQIGATPAAFDTSQFSPKISEIFTAIQRERGFTDFVRAATVPACDYFVPQPGMILEFDESQHFTPLRRLALSRYPSALPLGFDREEWIDLCRRIGAHDNDPADRDEQRAWYDTLRDFLPTILNLHPTVRLYAGGFGSSGSREPWCKLDAKSTEEFRQILSERAHFWTIRVLSPQTARYGRLVVDGGWGGDVNAARQLLRDVAVALRPVHRLTCLSTCGAFLRFDWPQELPPRGNRNPDAGEIAVLIAAAERAVWSVLTDEVVNQLKSCCDYLTLGVDTKKDKISTTHNIVSQPHAELVVLVDLHKSCTHWTGKFYPTSQQEPSIIRFPDLQSHFVSLDRDPVMILGCHDLSVYSPRGQAKATGWRRELSAEFRDLAKQRRPTVVLHHPHTTIKCRTWRQQWQRLEHELPFVKEYLGTGAYSYRDEGWNKRNQLEQVLDSTQRGDILTVLVTPGVTEHSLTVARPAE
jgi:hypothetical protein